MDDKNNKYNYLYYNLESTRTKVVKFNRLIVFI